MSLAAYLHQRVSPFSVAGKLLRLPLHLVPSGMVVRVLGGVNRGSRWIAGAATAGCWVGSYEEDHQQALKRLVRAGMVVYDAGANVGFYTLACARAVGPMGHVFSFEPDARNAMLLRRHIQLNGLQNVTVVQAAISDRCSLAAFQGEREQGRISESGTYLVPTISLDMFVMGGRPPPDFVKMDVEGAELLALTGAAEIVRRAKTSWMVATHSAALNSQCRAIFTKAGYALSGVDATASSLEHPDFLAVPG